jgi:hypothetical protein
MSRSLCLDSWLGFPLSFIINSATAEVMIYIIHLLGFHISSYAHFASHSASYSSLFQTFPTHGDFSLFALLSIYVILIHSFSISSYLIRSFICGHFIKVMIVLRCTASIHRSLIHSSISNRILIHANNEVVLTSIYTI